MDPNVIPGYIVLACALGFLTFMVLWCRRSIDRIAARGFGTVREIRRHRHVDRDDTISTGLSRDLTLFHVTMMGVGMMIGAGVFLGIGRSMGISGPGGTILTFALNGCLAILTAMSYAELSSAIPRAGGAYNFTRIAFGRGPSFMAGWMEWFASSVAGSMYALTLSIYTLDYLQQLGLMDWAGGALPVVQRVFAVLVAAFFVYINYRGASETGKVGAIFTLGQMLFLVLIVIVGGVVALRDPSRVANFRPFVPYGWMRVLATMGFTYVAFEGYEVIAQAGDETIDPKSNLPKAMLYSVYCVTITYVAVVFASLVAVKAGSPGVDGEPFAWIGRFEETGFGQAVRRLMPMAGLLLTLAVIFAATSAMNATIYSATRASYALGRDRLLPGALAKISPRRKTPWVALAATAGIVLLAAAFLPMKDVPPVASMMFLMLFLVVNLAVIKIRRTMGDELSYGFLMPLFPLFPIVGILAQAVLIGELAHVSLISWIIAATLLAGGALSYWLYGRSHAVATQEEIQVIEEEAAPAGEQDPVMVALANPDNAVELVRNTRKICAAKDARLDLLHMVPVPDQMALSDAEDYVLAGQESIVEAMLYFARTFPTSTSIRYCRSVARGITSSVREKSADMLILGWHGEAPAHVFNLGSTLDPIVERAPCNVVILKDCGGNRDFRRVLVPVSGGPNSGALEMAGILTNPAEGEITVLNVESGGGEFDPAQFVQEQAQSVRLPLDHVRVESITSHGVAQAILEQSEHYDLVVIGATQRAKLYQFASGSVPVIVARSCKKPLILVKAASTLPRAARWLHALGW